MTWIKILEAASEWGVPPWEIAAGDKALWWERWNANRSAKIKIDKEKANAQDRKNLRMNNRKRK